MASVGTLFPTSTSTTATSATGSQSSSSNSSTSSTSQSDSLANQNTFLQLLVAQLQYQDPTQPMDGTTFVTQLATFSDLSANMGSKTDLDAISKQYLGTVPSSDSGTSTGTTSTGTTSAGTTSSTGTSGSSTVTGG